MGQNKNTPAEGAKQAPVDRDPSVALADTWVNWDGGSVAAARAMCNFAALSGPGLRRIALVIELNLATDDRGDDLTKKPICQFLRCRHEFL